MGFNLINEYLQKGKLIENNFAKDLISAGGGEIMPNNESNDICKHIDILWKGKNDKIYSFDVKGARKKSRSDNEPSWDDTWIEFVNVNGKKGWLYGEEQFIVFEQKDSWIIIPRKKLLKCVMEKITDDTVYTDNPRTYYKKYQRKGRQDMIVQVPISLIKENSNKIIRKNGS